MALFSSVIVVDVTEVPPFNSLLITLNREATLSKFFSENKVGPKNAISNSCANSKNKTNRQGFVIMLEFDLLEFQPEIAGRTNGEIRSFVVADRGRRYEDFPCLDCE